jgi:poly(A) polymerase
VTLLSVADRLATRGERSQDAIAAHLELAARMLPDALRWRAEGPGEALLRGDELAAELGIEPGPRIGGLLEALSEARYAGELSNRREALSLARELLGSQAAPESRA